MKTLEIQAREAWRAWLAENHDQVSEIWLVYYKKATGIPSIGYNASVEEALCYGWVDSLIKSIDDQRYARKFTPRKDDSKWSPSNIRRVEKLIAAGRMTEHGLEKVEAAKKSGSWDSPIQKPQLDYDIPEAFARALEENPKARRTFEELSPTYQKQYLGWIITAKRPETREKRIRESVHLLEQGKKLGLR